MSCIISKEEESTAFIPGCFANYVRAREKLGPVLPGALRLCDTFYILIICETRSTPHDCFLGRKMFRNVALQTWARGCYSSSKCISIEKSYINTPFNNILRINVPSISFARETSSSASQLAQTNFPFKNSASGDASHNTKAPGSVAKMRSGAYNQITTIQGSLKEQMLCLGNTIDSGREKGVDIRSSCPFTSESALISVETTPGCTWTTCNSGFSAWK